MEKNSFEIFERRKYEDNRGNLSETFVLQDFQNKIGHKIKFVQDNLVQSFKNSVRGLHYQVSPKSQGKYVSVIEGEIFDVIVDIRKNSKNFGCSYTFNLSSDNRKSLWVPSGFAHGFLTISRKSTVIYKLTDFYSKNHERSIKWNSKQLLIEWPIKKNILISEKDENAKEFDEIEFD